MGEQDGEFPQVRGGGSLILAWQIKGKKVLVVGGGEVSPLFSFPHDLHWSPSSYHEAHDLPNCLYGSSPPPPPPIPPHLLLSEHTLMMDKNR